MVSFQMTAQEPHDFNDHKAHMQWRMERALSHQTTVPMIPQDLSGGSSSKAQTSAVLQKALSNPFVPIGMGATVACLIGMFAATLKRKPHNAQLFMRGRCVAQGFTVVTLVAGAMMIGGVGATGSPHKTTEFNTNNA